MNRGRRRGGPGSLDAALGHHVGANRLGRARLDPGAADRNALQQRRARSVLGRLVGGVRPLQRGEGGVGAAVWTTGSCNAYDGIYAAKNGSIETIGAKTWIGELWVQK
jgi:hypothetical protein